MQQSLSIDDITAVRYYSRHLSLSRIYFSILAQRRYLETQDFICDWEFGESGAKLPNEVDNEENINGIALASFRREDVGFYLLFSPRRNSFIMSGQTLITGEKRIYQRLMQTLTEVSSISGVELNLQYIVNR